MKRTIKHAVKSSVARIDIPRPQVSERSRKTLAKGFLGGMIVLSIGFLGGWLGSASQTDSLGGTGVNQQVILNESQLISQLAKDVGPSVVSVNVLSATQAQTPFGFSRPIEQASAGTGIIISEDGLIVTNRHVVPIGATQISITLSDGTELENVEVVGRTNENDPLDIAFLKITDKQGKDLKAAKLGDSSKVQVGDKVVAIGNALGQFQNTVTAGIISGYGRSVEAGDDAGGSETLQNLFQTDASINEGNSGGPLLNINGEVIGINTAVAGGSAENIGFSIPVNDIQGLVKSVLQNGKLLRPYLGVRYITLTDAYAFQLDIDIKRGAYIVPRSDGGSSIVSGSPAEKAGLRERDIIIKVDGDAIDERNSLISLVSRKQVGETVVLTVVRDGSELSVDVVLEAASQD